MDEWTEKVTYRGGCPTQKYRPDFRQCHIKKNVKLPDNHQVLGFLIRGQHLWGDTLGKIAKNCMEITKSRFLGQNHGGHEGEQANFLSSGDKILPVPP